MAISLQQNSQIQSGMIYRYTDVSITSVSHISTIFTYCHDSLRDYFYQQGPIIPAMNPF